MKLSSRPNSVPVSAADLIFYILTHKLMLSYDLAMAVTKVEIESGVVTLTLLDTAPVQSMTFIL